MKRQKQTFEELSQALSAVDANGLDEFGEHVVKFIGAFPIKDSYSDTDLKTLLSQDFQAAITTFQLFLGKSKDEFKVAVREHSKIGALGIKKFKTNPDGIIAVLKQLELPAAIKAHVHKPTTWHDLLIERLMGGRGRAIKGQKRGRGLEDFTENLVKKIFGEGNYDPRCRFVGKEGETTEKADFAIPSKSDPRIIIEVKAYGATGSKQTDVLGDVHRIVEEKRHDTTFLIVTDGLTWLDRANDLKKLVKIQNKGAITRIYTQKMASELEKDLKVLKKEHGL